eukprot:scaffold2990_cov239-Pinguiococcus_pyrenoidosus.AAC.8
MLGGENGLFLTSDARLEGPWLPKGKSAHQDSRGEHWERGVDLRGDAGAPTSLAKERDGFQTAWKPWLTLVDAQSGVNAIGQAELITPPEVIVATYKVRNFASPAEQPCLVSGQRDSQSVLRCRQPGEPLDLELKVDVWPDLTFVRAYEGHTIEVRGDQLQQPCGESHPRLT